MNRTLLRGAWRHQDLVRSLPSVTRVSASRQLFPIHSICKANIRAFTSQPRLHSEQSSPNSSAPGSKETVEKSEAQTQSSHIPWYLREESPVSETPQVASRDQIPELPEDPPAILPDVLEYTFKDLGLDDLKLMDLRSLESPPPLGANVIMIIGTARSVKHLNVSADRMCRWLRSTYKLSPYADGLLGRNELKIKLRRKARRARLASRSGAMFDDKDDGITTGWICVNAGVVEEKPVEDQDLSRFEGFGKTVRGTRIVIQMFTEEKRFDVDIETLWQRTLDRAERDKRKYSEAASQTQSEETANSSISEAPSGPTPKSTMSFPFQQTRRFHSSGAAMTAESDGVVEKRPRNKSAHMKEISWEVELERLSEKEVIDELQSICTALSTETSSMLKKKLYVAFSHCVASNYKISDKLGLAIFAALLPGPAQATHNLRDRNLALRVLDYLAARGMNVLNMEVFNIIYKSAIYEARGDQEKALQNGREVFKVFETFNVPFDIKGARTFMVSSFQNGDYDSFWHMWHQIPLQNDTRTAEDYTMLFDLHADLGDETRAQECVSSWAPMMKREEPPLPLQGELVQNLMACLLVVDRNIAETAQAGSSDLALLWRECEDSLNV
ncbi:ATPase synthesis protein 25 mitochondrial [Aspergillus nanangensis]|uniref:ATPase synthesis protein 25 n=1 Tax=Aspergillus nanangensis TaxID=2582783 RepID=A0AAD4CTJ7_ASPNN|nr:ATPase synthesis protein 25 mitochondrial [Aspergillus nanangensis]